MATATASEGVITNIAKVVEGVAIVVANGGVIGIWRWRLIV